MSWRSDRRGRPTADEAFIRAVFDEHGRALLAYATRLLGDRQAAEDVVQEALVRAWRHPEVLVYGKGCVRGWLLVVTRNLIIDRVRAGSARPAEVAEDPTAEPAVQDHAETVVNWMVVIDALSSLSEEHRAVLVEIYFKGNSVAETATALDVPAGTVRSRCFYALRILRGRFEARGELQEARR